MVRRRSRRIARGPGVPVLDAPPRGRAAARRGRLPEGHAGRQHAEPDGARHRPRRARVLHRARRAPDDLEAEHAADGDRGHGPGHAQPGERPARAHARAGLRHSASWVYLFYSQLPDNTNTQVVRASRSTATRSTWPPSRRSSRSRISAGSAATPAARCTSAPDGSLFIATGDNTNPFDSGGYNPIDERAGRSAWDAQRTSANTNDLNGKILRIKPIEIPTGTPGVGNDVHDPARATCSRPARQDAARDLRHGLPQPVPDHRRPGDRAGC